MNNLVQPFGQLVGQGTRQIGQYYCIPAVVSNALRLLGGADFTQTRIRDEWYATKGRSLEPSLDDQMKEAGPDVIDAIRQRTDFSTRFDTEPFQLPRESSFFDEGKADKTVAFIAKHVMQDHPVLVSTDTIPWEQGMLTRFCCHMWLVLDVDLSMNEVYAHDPATDLLFMVPITMAVPVMLGQSHVNLEIGLRGRLTTTNYFCTAFWRK